MRVVAFSFTRALSIWKSTVRLVSPKIWPISEDVLPRAMLVLSHQHDPIVRRERKDRGETARLADVIILDDRAVRELDRIAAQP